MANGSTHLNTDGAEERTCAACGDPFLYTAAEQRFRAEQGMAAPTLCPRCRAERRAERNADLLDGRASSGVEAPSDRRRRRGRDASDTNGSSERYPAICADCGKSTMVPFIPRGDRPVYCRTCFNTRRGR